MKSNSKPSILRGRAARLLALFALCGAGFDGSATVIFVKNLNDSGPGSLRQAIASAHPGDYVVCVVAGKITLTSGTLQVSQPITIDGFGGIEVNGNDQFRVFEISNNLSGSTTTISGMTIAHGRADIIESLEVDPTGGAGIEFFGYGNLAVIQCIVRDNLLTKVTQGRPTGAGILSGGSLLLRGCTVTRNHTEFEGGGIAIVEGGSGMIVDCDINHNQADGNGGGILIDAAGVVSISTSNISDNTAVGGGGIATSFIFGATLIVRQSTIANNSAINFGPGAPFGHAEPDTYNVGGGIDLNYGDCSIHDSTISGNYSLYLGGGIYQGDSSLKLRNVTIYDNQGGPIPFVNQPPDPAATGGGGIFVNPLYGAHCQIQNCIIAGNWLSRNGPRQLNDTGGTLHSLGNNLIQDPFHGALTGDLSGCIFLKDPKLAPLGNYGGKTRTHGLLLGSPAIDAGATVPLLFPTDQRGVPRPVGPRWDIGAFEGTLLLSPQ